MLQATAVSSDLGLTAVPGTHMNPNPAEFVSMFDGININNCVLQFSENPVHGTPSSMTANNNHQAPKQYASDSPALMVHHQNSR